MAKITPLSLYVINQVIYRSYVIGLYQENLSIVLEKSDSYVNNIFSEKLNAVFAYNDYKIIADALKCETHDLLPPPETPYNDGTLVEKIVFSLSNPKDTEQVIFGMIENNYFKTNKSLDDIYSHLYLVKNNANPVKRKVVYEVLTKLTERGNLKLNKDKYSI